MAWSLSANVGTPVRVTEAQKRREAFRAGAIHTSGDFEIESGDALFVAGSDRAVREFDRR
jgi:Trk K+ transport system NAD-binding subunit